MNIKHIKTPFNNGTRIQHRLMLGSQIIFDTVLITSSEANHDADACLSQYVERLEAQERAEKQKQAEAQKTGDSHE